MKLPTALALAARPMDVPVGRLRAILRTLAEQQATATDGKPPGVVTATVSDDRVDCRDPAPSLGLILLASHSLLTRTINLLK